MPMRYMMAILLCLLFSCQQKIIYPSGGFDYPRLIDTKDSSFLIYPYKDSFSTFDSLKTATWGALFLRAYNEPNLSPGPEAQVTFRLMYDEWPRPPLVISLTKNKLTVKQAVQGHVD